MAPNSSREPNRRAGIVRTWDSRKASTVTPFFCAAETRFPSATGQADLAQGRREDGRGPHRLLAMLGAMQRVGHCCLPLKTDPVGVRTKTWTTRR